MYRYCIFVTKIQILCAQHAKWQPVWHSLGWIFTSTCSLRVMTPLARFPGKPPANHGTLVSFELVLLILFVDGLTSFIMSAPPGCRISLQQRMYRKLRYPSASNAAGAPCRLQLLCDAELLAEAEAWWLENLRFDLPSQSRNKRWLWKMNKCYKGCLRPIKLNSLLNLEGDDLCLISKTEFNLQLHWLQLPAVVREYCI